MNILKTTGMALCCAIALTSCEMKRELMGGDKNNGSVGRMELNVQQRMPASTARTAGNMANGTAGSRVESTADASQFPVTIEGVNDKTYLRQYAHASEIEQYLIMPVGEYKVSAHTPGNLEKQMNAPYFGKETTFTIEKDLTTSVDVVCKMLNSRITLVYGDDFIKNFSAWQITIDDGSNSVIAYDNTTTTPQTVYWHFENNTVEAFTVNITATTITGLKIEDTRTFSKKSASNSYDDVPDFFTGGDALEINMGATANLTGQVNGVTVTTNIAFDEHDEYVELPAYDETPKPEDPQVDPDEPVEGVTLSLPQDITYDLSDNIGSIAANARIASEAGLKNIVVRITPGNKAFEDILAELNTSVNQNFLGDMTQATGGVDLIDNTWFNELLTTVELPSGPKKNDKEYLFPIHVFFQFLNITGPTDQGKAHEFHISVVDNDGKSKEGVVKVTITDRENTFE